MKIRPFSGGAFAGKIYPEGKDVAACQFAENGGDDTIWEKTLPALDDAGTEGTCGVITTDAASVGF